MYIDAVKEMIKGHEGSVVRNGNHVVYKCPAGKNTVGYGRNLDDKGLSQHEAEMLLENDIRECIMDLQRIFHPMWTGRSDEVKAICIDMRFALGGQGFRRWQNFSKSVVEDDVDGMIRNLKDSKWYLNLGHHRINDYIKLLDGSRKL